MCLHCVRKLECTKSSAEMGINMAKSIMIQGTMSNVGKSLLAAGLCRILKEDGYRVAPFKSQNMALNSFITKNRLEMGRAQVVQAEACGIEPEVAMNPILLKPVTDMGSQVILMGEVQGNMKAMDYFRKKKEYIPVIKTAYESLESRFDIIVIEGAGSPAEINLKQDDIVNMGMAQLANAPVLLAGDIDRGGVFAQLIGTVMLLEQEENNRIKGLIINKFRGDKEILRPGLSMLEEKCKKKVLGVVPYLDLDIEDEDSLSECLERRQARGGIDVAVLRLPKISNFTDFQALNLEPVVSVRYVKRLSELGEPDLLVVPGTKNTVQDMEWLRQQGLEAGVLRLAKKGTPVFGICGGYQMLGEVVEERQEEKNRESPSGKIRGMGLLPVRTVFEPEKTRKRKKGRTEALPGIWQSLSGKRIEGYEIHMGISRQTGEDNSCFARLDGKQEGCVFENVMGTYLHGVFDEEDFRKALVQLLCKRKGIDYLKGRDTDYKEYKEKQYTALADALRESLDMEEIYRIIEAGV